MNPFRKYRAKKSAERKAIKDAWAIHNEHVERLAAIKNRRRPHKGSISGIEQSAYVSTHERLAREMGREVPSLRYGGER